MSIFKNAKWITYHHGTIFLGNRDIDRVSTAPYLRKKFTLKSGVKTATLYICGLGYFVAYTNGEAVTDTVLNPAFTNYEKTVMYNVYDIKNLHKGENVITVSLGDGFYNADSVDVWNFINATWRDVAKCILRLVVEYDNGVFEEIISDKTFKGSNGPVVFNAVRNGTTYDARKSLGQWTKEAYNDDSWDFAMLAAAAPGKFKEQTHLPIKIMREIEHIAANKIDECVKVYDFGINTSGWAKISFTAEKDTQIKLVYGERLYNSGRVDIEHIRCFVKSGDFQTDTYIANGEGKETFNSEFAYHGFRYVEVICETVIPGDFYIIAQEVRTSMTERGKFECSDKTINAIQAATVQATKTNMHGMPTDCPHREKNGWTGDAQLSAEQCLLNLNPESVYTKWMNDFIDAQRESGQLPGIIPSTGWGYNWGSGPAWDSAIVIIPYMQYLYRGDMDILRMMYEPIKKYIAYMDLMATDGICCFGLNDWCCPKSAKTVCSTELTDTAYYFYDTITLAKIAKIIGFLEESIMYEKKAEFIKSAFRNRFIKDFTKAELNVEACQTAYGCILYQGLLNEDEKAIFFDALIKQIEDDGKLTTSGIMGAKYVYNALSEYGRADLIYDMIATEKYPSLGYMIKNGATTLWEDFQGEASLNHHMFGDISAVFYKAFAGLNVDPQNPAFKHTIFAPQFIDNLEFASAEYQSIYGIVAINWNKSGNQVILKITIPDTCTGQLCLPKHYKTNINYKKMMSGDYEIVLDKI